MRRQSKQLMRWIQLVDLWFEPANSARWPNNRSSDNAAGDAAHIYWRCRDPTKCCTVIWRHIQLSHLLTYCLADVMRDQWPLATRMAGFYMQDDVRSIFFAEPALVMHKYQNTHWYSRDSAGLSMPNVILCCLCYFYVCQQQQPFVNQLRCFWSN